MHYVYLIKSIKNRKLYIGYTSNLEKRFKSHNQGKNKFTKSNIPYEMIYYEAFRSKKDARLREIALKNQGRQKQFLIQNLKNSLLI